MEPANVFGAKLRELRQKRGYSLQGLSDLLTDARGDAGPSGRGVNKSYISDLERGAKPPPSRKQINRLCNALQCIEREREELFLAAGFVPPNIARAVPLSDLVNALEPLSRKSDQE